MPHSYLFVDKHTGNVPNFELSILCLKHTSSGVCTCGSTFHSHSRVCNNEHIELNRVEGDNKEDRPGDYRNRPASDDEAIIQN